MSAGRGESTKFHKQLIFDLDTVLLRQLFGKAGYTKTYDRIKKFLTKRGFEHIEGSAYLSEQPITNMQLARVLADLKAEYPYLNKCVKKIHSANVSGRHSWGDHFDYDGTLDGVNAP